MTASPSPADRAATLFATIDPDARMDAYYYSFDPTGIGIIDEILSQVAIAGKMYHSTEWWNDNEDGTPTHQERIQKAAQDATDAVRTLIIDLLAAVERAEADADRLGASLRVCKPMIEDRRRVDQRAEALRLHDEAVAQQ